MQPSAQLYAVVKHFEGFSAVRYTCPAGLPTIGWGHVIRPQDGNLTRIGPEKAEALLRADIALAARSVARLVHVPLTQGQFDALTDFTFNLGGAALQRSTLRAKLNRGEYEAVPDQLRRWVYAGKKKLPGLIRRREAEAALWRGGVVVF